MKELFMLVTEYVRHTFTGLK